MWKHITAFCAVLAFVSLTMSVDARQQAPDGDELTRSVPPTALYCEEQSATLRDSDTLFATSRSDFTERYALLSDPAATCRNPDVQTAADYERTDGSCYLLRAIGSGEPDKPLSCIERHSGDPSEGAPVASLRCTGWDLRVSALVDGGFSTNREVAEEGFLRSSHGNCQRY